MKKNPKNDYKIDENKENDKILKNLIKENTRDLDWEKALPLSRYAGEAPPIILDNIIEEENINTVHQLCYEIGLQTT